MSRIILKSKKQEIVKEINRKISLSKGFMIADYDHISVNLFTQLRSILIKNNCEIKIYKNTFFKLALKEKKLDSLSSDLLKKNSFLFCYDDFLKGIKLLYNFNKKHQTFNFKSGFYEDKIINHQELSQLAKLPTHQELLSTFVMLLLSSVLKIILCLQQISTNKAQ